MQPDIEEQHENNVYRVVNNGGFSLDSPGNEGYYTRSHHFQTTDEWDSIFDHIVGPPYALYDTSNFIYSLVLSGRALRHESFPEVVYIPLPSCEPGFKRCIFHVETVNTRTNNLTGQHVPVIVKYHVNHPIAQAVTRLFEVETHSHPFYQTKEQILMLTSHNDEWINQMCRQFHPPCNDFETFDGMIFPVADYVLPDPALVIRANREISIPNYDVEPREAQEAYERWKNIVYPQTATAEERREMYATFAAEQVNMHRYSRLQWVRDYPNRPNPIELPHNIVLNHNNHRNGREHVQENNPADRNHAGQNLANHYIQALYNGQNNDERGRIAATEVRLRVVANQNPDHNQNQNQNQEPIFIPAPALPVNRVLELDG
jgi:hypothetical protein